jgi:hypothetical protein
MSSSDSGSPTAARMLMSVQRFGGGAFLATSSEAGGCSFGSAAGCGLGLGAGLAAGGASAGPAGGALTARHGVRHGFVSAAAEGTAPYSAVTTAIGAMARNREDRAW